MLLTRGRAGTERLLAVALLLDAVLGGQLDLAPTRPHLVAGPELADVPPLLADLRARVLESPAASPHVWIERAAVFAPARVAIELITAGAAEPLPRRFQRHFTLSVDALAEARSPPTPARPILARPRRRHVGLRRLPRTPVPAAPAHTPARGRRDPGGCVN